MAKPKRIAAKVLLVEGDNDQHVVWKICEQHSIPETFEVNTPKNGGIEQVFKEIDAYLNQRQVNTLGIMIDADSDLQTRWQQVRRELSKIGYELPEELPLDGLIWHDEKHEKTIGAWIMPDNISPGALEHFLIELMPDDDILAKEVNLFLDQIEAQQLHSYKTQHRVKAFVHIWLACQKSPGMPYGTSIEAKSLDANKPLAQRFSTWLRQLFD